METPERRAHARRAASCLVGLLALGVVVAGCDASSDTALTADEVAARYGYDVATAVTTPVYALVPQYRSPDDGYARDLLARRCLQGVVDYPAVPPGSAAGSTPGPVADARTGEVAFTEEVAQQWGYPWLHVQAGSGAEAGSEVTPAIQDAMVACGAQTDDRLGQAPERAVADIEAAGWTAVTAAPDVQQAVAAWRTCMAPAGVVDLPGDPHDMPSASVVSVTANQDAQGAETDAGPVPISDREREVAVLDARCRAQVDYDGAVLRARAGAELTAIGRDVEGFEAARRAYEGYEAKVDAVITELG